MTTANSLTAEVDSPYAWFRLGVSVLLCTIGGVAMWSVVVVLPSLQAEFGVARGSASLPYTLTMLGTAPATSWSGGCSTGSASSCRCASRR